MASYETELKVKAAIRASIESLLKASGVTPDPAGLVAEEVADALWRDTIDDVIDEERWEARLEGDEVGYARARNECPSF